MAPRPVTCSMYSRLDVPHTPQEKMRDDYLPSNKAIMLQKGHRVNTNVDKHVAEVSPLTEATIIEICSTSNTIPDTPYSMQVILVIATYWTISISMVFINKYLVGDRDSQNLAIFVAWIQCIVTVAFVMLMKLLQGWLRYTRTGKFSLGVPFRLLGNPEILKMTVSFASMLAFNNLCLKVVGVPFFQVARSLTLIFTVVFSIIILKRTISVWVLGCCTLVVVGFILGVNQENIGGTLSIFGIAFGIVTSVFIALNGIFTKSALDVVNHDSVILALLGNIIAVGLFVPFVLYTEQLQEAIRMGSSMNYYFWLLLSGSGIMAFSMAWISALQIDLTSPVTHHISANSKSIVQTVIAVIYYQESKPWLWWCSIVLVAGGAVLYAMVRLHEGKVADKKGEFSLIRKATV